MAKEDYHEGQIKIKRTTGIAQLCGKASTLQLFSLWLARRLLPTLAHPVTLNSVHRGSFSFVKEVKRLMNRVEFSTIKTAGISFGGQMWSLKKSEVACVQGTADLALHYSLISNCCNSH